MFLLPAPLRNNSHSQGLSPELKSNTGAGGICRPSGLIIFLGLGVFGGLVLGTYLLLLEKNKNENAQPFVRGAGLRRLNAPFNVRRPVPGTRTAECSRRRLSWRRGAPITKRRSVDAPSVSMPILVSPIILAVSASNLNLPPRVLPAPVQPPTHA